MRGVSREQSAINVCHLYPIFLPDIISRLAGSLHRSPQPVSDSLLLFSDPNLTSCHLKTCSVLSPPRLNGQSPFIQSIQHVHFQLLSTYMETWPDPPTPPSPSSDIHTAWTLIPKDYWLCLWLVLNFRYGFFLPHEMRSMDKNERSVFRSLESLKFLCFQCFMFPQLLSLSNSEICNCCCVHFTV